MLKSKLFRLLFLSTIALIVALLVAGCIAPGTANGSGASRPSTVERIGQSIETAGRVAESAGLPWGWILTGIGTLLGGGATVRHLRRRDDADHEDSTERFDAVKKAMDYQNEEIESLRSKGNALERELLFLQLRLGDKVTQKPPIPQNPGLTAPAPRV